MSTNAVPIPISDPIAQPRRKEFREGQKDPLEGKITQPWVDYFTDLGGDLQTAALRIRSATVTAQSASIGATDMSGGTLAAGLYRISYYARITQAAGVSSSLTVTFDWTEGGVTPSYSGAAMTGNTTTTVQMATFPIQIDGLSPVRYSTTYASAGAPVMTYALYAIIEDISA